MSPETSRTLPQTLKVDECQKGGRKDRTFLLPLSQVYFGEGGGKILEWGSSLNFLRLYHGRRSFIFIYWTLRKTVYVLCHRRGCVFCIRFNWFSCFLTDLECCRHCHFRKNFCHDERNVILNEECSNLRDSTDTPQKSLLREMKAFEISRFNLFHVIARLGLVSVFRSWGKNSNHYILVHIT